MGMNSNFEADSQIEYKLDKMIKGILGNYFIIKDIKHDLEEGTDFEIYIINPSRNRVAVRLRRNEFFLKFPNDFTIRWKRPSGVKTEIDKIRLGLVDYILYGFLSEDESKIIQYFIGDLKIFRENENNILPMIKMNKNQDSELAIYKLNDFPDNFKLYTWPLKKMG